MQQNNLRQKSKQQQKLLNDFNFFLMPIYAVGVDDVSAPLTD